MAHAMTDIDARKAILQRFYDAYREKGLWVIVMGSGVAESLGLDSAQARRCFDYLTAKGLIRPMTLAGGFSPTVALVDYIEECAA